MVLILGLEKFNLVQVFEDIYIANMIGQRDIRKGRSGPPIRYEGS